MKTSQSETVSKPWSMPMTIYKQPGSPYYYYDFYFEKRRYQASTHLRNKTIAHRVEMSRSEEHTSELQSHLNLVCRLLLVKKKQPPLDPRATTPIPAIFAVSC